MLLLMVEGGVWASSKLNIVLSCGVRQLLLIFCSLALAEMKMLLTAVYSRFSTLPDPTMKPEDMEMDDQLISSRPLGQKCLLKFRSLNKAEK